MLLPLNALGLARNSETSIWSSETPGRWTRVAIFDRVSPETTLTESSAAPEPAPSVLAVLAVLGAAARRVVAAADGDSSRFARASAAAALAAARFSRASARAASRCSALVMAGVANGAGAGGAADITGEVEAPGAGCAPARIVAGGSNSNVYSRTSRPVAHEI